MFVFPGLNSNFLVFFFSRRDGQKIPSEWMRERGKKMRIDVLGRRGGEGEGGGGGGGGANLLFSHRYRCLDYLYR